MKDLYNENFKTRKKEIEEDIRGWKDLPHSIGKINMLKVDILEKVIYKFSPICIKIPKTFFTKIAKKKKRLTFVWTPQIPQLGNATLRKSIAEASQCLLSNYII